MRRVALILLLALACTNSDSTTAPRSTTGPDFDAKKMAPKGIEGTWAGPYPDGRNIVYTFSFTKTQEVDSRTGNLAWVYNASYALTGPGGNDSGEFTVDYEPPNAYWGSTSFGVLESSSTLLVGSDLVPDFTVTKQKH